ncbi:uncharacterized protein PGTG_05214 [Puccinia graminis f. sp. tritici CRL 75-36-700-3]|uniref:Ras modification protein ERF4 n=1 Tax=Puccinia graminis f. sp. tritici (strain CRL 75-36-700-3 / race SCCL) TaxID=418459 RepID=E3K759_PUCGT|nr:uncharacterized protein PGTG_05214 [Puccinia graminis f. sp. tritici CRL 75-36-700-3]EFP79989.1 hypothetical protein PGTG_05214 [Puccinia graminis f. sp. tritici CRL 75-36-700-3]
MNTAIQTQPYQHHHHHHHHHITTGNAEQEGNPTNNTEEQQHNNNNNGRTTRNQACPRGSMTSEIVETNDEQLNDYSSEHAQSIFGTSPAGQVGQSKPRAIVRIERDYSARGATCGRVQFWDGWVKELEGRISPLQLQNTLNDFNLILASAYDPYSSILDNTLAVLSLYISPWILGTHHKRQMNLFKDTLEQYNKSVYNPVGLNILHPQKVAFLFLEIEYY